MKKKFLLVSMIAAAMLTASCSKEDNGDNSEQPVNVEQQIVQNTRPIVIKVDKKTSLSKVGTSDGYDLTFSADDKLVLTDGTTQYAELDLQAEDAGKSIATFTGNISTDADGKEIYATIGTPLTGVQTSSESLAVVVANNCYLKSAAFEYRQETALNVELSDQNAYLVFSVSAGQKKVNIGGETDWYPTEGNIVNQKLYVAVPAGAVSGRFFGTKTLDASTIYTITREDVVDLGQTVDGRKIVWKTTNETSGTATSYNQSNAAYANEKYYTWSNACAFGRLDNKDSYQYISGSADPFRLPTKKEFENLATFANNSTFVTHNGMSCKEFSNAYGSVFFPAAGDYGGDDAGDYGYYWSGGSFDGGDRAYDLYFYDGNAKVDWLFVGGKISVRLVRGL